MRRFKNILLVCDEGGIHDALFARAIRLAKLNDASVTLIDVIEAAPGELSRLFGSLPGATTKDVEAEVVTFHSARLAKIAARFRAHRVETTQQVLQGIAFVEVIRKVLRDRPDLVMKGAVVDDKPRAPFFASTDMHLLRKCPCPVWIMNPGEHDHYPKVLAAVDPNHVDETTEPMNRLIMDLATSISKADDSALNIVSAWSLDEEDTLRDSGFAGISQEDVDRLVEQKRADAERSVKDLVAHYPDVDPNRQIHLVKGSAETAIPDVAEREAVELIVMGTVGRTGIPGVIIGNTAEAILSRVKCSVLAVKPPDFETPVTLESDAKDPSQAAIVENLPIDGRANAQPT